MNRKTILIAHLKAILFAQKQMNIFQKRYEPPKPQPQVNNGTQKPPTTYNTN